MALSHTFRLLCVVLLGLVWTNGGLGAEQQVLGQPPNRPAKKPNVVFILTDDQDLHMDSLSYMPNLKKHLLDEGTFFQRHYCTIAVCCPSRVSLWTGKAAHNTNVTDVHPPYGGYPKFISEGLNDAYLPVWLQEAGYNTYYTGKLFNAHTIFNYDSPFPQGFNGTEFLLDPNTYQYLNATFQRNRDPPVNHQGEYSTDLLAKKAFGLLDDAVTAKAPFFLTIAPTAPHSNAEIPSVRDGFPTVPNMTTPIPAKRHEHLFPDVKIPRTPNFNPKKPSSVSWISKLPLQSQENVDYDDLYYRARLQTLQAVDELIDDLVKRLDDYGILEDTYIFYSSDNGFHIGQHRLQPGKECGFEEDVNIPLIVRGPGVPKGQTTNIVTSHTDLAPTFLELVGAELRDDFDGASIPLTASSLQKAKTTRHEHVGIEYWGWALTEGNYFQTKYFNNTYKAIRVIGKGYNLYYSVWCSGEHELYDLNNDPYQIHNLIPFSEHDSIPLGGTEEGSPSLFSIPVATLLPRLDSLILVLKTCKARQCTHPWEILHPQGDVKDLYDALSPKYDTFYIEEQNRVSFSKCEEGYILESEGPSHVRSYGDEMLSQMWPHLT